MNFEDQIIVRKDGITIQQKGFNEDNVNFKRQGQAYSESSFYTMFFVGVYETNCYNYFI